MDAWIVIIAIAFAVWWISNNKIRSTSKTKVIETSEYKTQTGKIYVEKTYEYDDREMSIKDRPKYTPSQPRNYTPLQQPVTIEHDDINKIENRDAFIERTRAHSAELRRRSDANRRKEHPSSPCAGPAFPSADPPR